MAFVFKITTTTSPQTFTIPCQNVGTFNATVDWGDGGATSSITAYNDGDLAHSYATAGQYTITITGTFPNIYFNNAGDKLLVNEVVDLGDVGWTRLNRAFYGCSNLTSVGGDTANTSLVTDMYATFRNCTSLTTLDVSNWNTSLVTNMGETFANCSGLTTLDVSAWDTSKVTSMFYMFYNCSSLTALDVSAWDTSKVTNMQLMFYNCSSLTTLDVSNWDTSKVTIMQQMFLNCTSLTTLDVSNWNTSLVTNMYQTFANCSSLTTIDVSNWNTSLVTNMGETFANCSGLTTIDVSNWNTSLVTTLNRTFHNCSSLTTLDVSSWDTSKVTSMFYMFYNCPNLSGLVLHNWDVAAVTNGTDFLYSSNNALSTEEYNQILINWSQQSVKSGVSWHFGDAKYSAPNKVQVFAGVRKLSDAAQAVAVELSASTASNNGAFVFYAPNGASPSYAYTSKGTTSVTADASTGFTAPLSNVAAAIGDISGDSAILRVNGTQAASSASDQGTGNFLAYPLYIGRRGGSSLPFNGRLYQLITRFGPNLSDARIEATERYTNKKTKAY